jgi:hypothetical protein
MSSSHWQLFHLRVAAEADPGVLARIIEPFQNRNVTPRKVLAEWATTGLLHVEVQVAGMAEETINLIAAKLGQHPCILNAYWSR